MIVTVFEYATERRGIKICRQRKKTARCKIVEVFINVQNLWQCISLQTKK
ncbi:MAG: hypothetical protein OEZ21_08180 [Candidatus Bathyarchaeota archaeon]|nr:hypothetical protein [Candidatus Bathyarchaeota archaeon]